MHSADTARYVHEASLLCCWMQLARCLGETQRNFIAHQKHTLHHLNDLLCPIYTRPPLITLYVQRRVRVGSYKQCQVILLTWFSKSWREEMLLVRCFNSVLSAHKAGLQISLGSDGPMSYSILQTPYFTRATDLMNCT